MHFVQAPARGDAVKFPFERTAQATLQGALGNQGVLHGAREQREPAVQALLGVEPVLEQILNGGVQCLVKRHSRMAASLGKGFVVSRATASRKRSTCRSTAAESPRGFGFPSPPAGSSEASWLSSSLSLFSTWKSLSESQSSSNSCGNSRLFSPKQSAAHWMSLVLL